MPSLIYHWYLKLKALVLSVCGVVAKTQIPYKAPTMNLVNLKVKTKASGNGHLFEVTKNCNPELRIQAETQIMSRWWGEGKGIYEKEKGKNYMNWRKEFLLALSCLSSAAHGGLVIIKDVTIAGPCGQGVCFLITFVSSCL